VRRRNGPAIIFVAMLIVGAEPVPAIAGIRDGRQETATIVVTFQADRYAARDRIEYLEFGYTKSC
jgi:hypothetical protein